MKAFLTKIVVILSLTLLASGTVCAEKRTYCVTGELGQTEARTMLDLVNSFRTGEDAWYWEEDNETKHFCTDLQPLVYDYGLEKMAMQRAMEIAISFSHTRPNGESCFTAENLSGASYTDNGENIGAGYDTVYEAFNAFKEDDCDFSGQGHRRNMLLYYNCIGVGHVYYEGYHYWVQELGYSQSPEINKTEALDETHQFRVEIESNNVTSVSGIETIVSVDDEFEKPKAGLSFSSTFPDGSIRPIDDLLDQGWINLSPDIIDIQNESIIALKTGEAQITSTALGREVVSTVYVKPRSIKKTIIELEEGEWFFTGERICPSVTVTSTRGKVLEEGTDYSTHYQGNLHAGRASLFIDGLGNYDGFESVGYDIKSVPVSSVYFSEFSDYTYQAETIEPSFIGILENGYFLHNNEYNTDLKISYRDNIYVGTASIDIEGVGNFTGKTTLHFNILPAAVESATFSVPEGPYYFVGSEITPSVTGVLQNGHLIGEDDFTIAYNNNLNRGTAQVIITGKNNLQGTSSISFDILPRNIGECTLDMLPDQLYLSKETKPVLSLMNGDAQLIENKDYVIRYTNNAATGSGSVTISGIGNYDSSVNNKYNLITEIPIRLPKAVRIIQRKAFRGLSVSAIQINNGAEIITDAAFEELEQPTFIIVPDSVNSISDNAFLSSNVIIVANKDSYAWKWAEAHGITVSEMK